MLFMICAKWKEFNLGQFSFKVSHTEVVKPQEINVVLLSFDHFEEIPTYRKCLDYLFPT